MALALPGLNMAAGLVSEHVRCVARCDVIVRRRTHGYRRPRRVLWTSSDGAWHAAMGRPRGGAGEPGPGPVGELLPGSGAAEGGLGPGKAPARRTAKRRKEETAAAAAMIPRGRPKSGRVWKDPRKKRFSHMIQDKPLHTSWEHKMKERCKRKLVKDLVRQLQEGKQKEQEEKKRRREENLKRRLENEQKAEIIQVIRNPLKLKRAKKKQLRRVEKRDTLALLQKVPVRCKAAAE
ncbi:coiled-coil domain-containing protein 86 [Rhea pennata]|uniref:coiled-coil domain-containing protein 86 n=1 Tax=Rhea pennata TaxID=8795 RepID=UPI002E25E11A